MSTSLVTSAAIDAALRTHLAPIELQVRDDSEAHRGHAGHSGSGGSHFGVRIRSPRFAGLNRVARHRLVYDALAALMSQGIHALAIDARAPGEA
ncbi:MAG: BolA family protein [Burkholderiales bacterium]